MRKQIYCLLSFLWISCLSVSAADRWAINSAGGITWQVDERVPHEDQIEMSGLRVSTVLRYGVDANGAFMLNRSMVWPFNVTSFTFSFSKDCPFTSTISVTFQAKRRIKLA